MAILDANMILRYLLDDQKEMAETAAKYIDNGRAMVTIEVIAEVTYVLKGVYSLEREKLAETISAFLQLVNGPDIDVLALAVKTYGEKNLDFVDCVLFAYHMVRNCEIATFDKKLLKLIRESDQEK